MGLRIEDVANLNRSLAGVGDAFAENRKEEGQTRKEDIEADFRKQMLAAELRRTGAEEGRNTLLGQQEKDRADHQTFTDILAANPFQTPASREIANAYLAKHPKWGAVGIQLDAPEKKPVPQPGQSSRVMELQKAREFRDKAAALGPEGDLDLQKWYVSAADDLEKGPISGGKTVQTVKTVPGATTPETTTATTAPQPTRNFGTSFAPPATATNVPVKFKKDPKTGLYAPAP